MVQLSGTYHKGKITLDKKIATDKPVKVLVTFVDDEVEVETNQLLHNRFSFAEGREILKNLKSSLSDAIIEERQEGL